MRSLPTPLVPGAIGAFAVEGSENVALKRAVLLGAASGEAPLMLALRERDLHENPADVKLVARRDGAGFRLDGIKLFVPYANLASGLVTPARPDRRRECARRAARRYPVVRPAAATAEAARLVVAVRGRVPGGGGELRSRSGGRSHGRTVVRRSAVARDDGDLH